METILGWVINHRGEELLKTLDKKVRFRDAIRKSVNSQVCNNLMQEKGKDERGKDEKDNNTRKEGRTTIIKS